MEEERLQILRLVETGRITPDQAAELLRALGPKDSARPTNGGRSGSSEADGGAYLLAADRNAGGPNWLRIRVTDRNGRQTADVQLPLSIVRVGLRIGARWVPQLRAIDPGWILSLLQLRTGQQVFNFKDAMDGDRLSITVE